MVSTLASVARAAQRCLVAAVSIVAWWCGLGRAEPDRAAARAAICASCPSLSCYRRRGQGGDLAARMGWCGRPMRPSDGPPATCGCLVLREAREGTAHAVVGATRVRAAGKLLVTSARCPQGRW